MFISGKEKENIFTRLSKVEIINTKVMENSSALWGALDANISKIKGLESRIIYGGLKDPESYMMDMIRAIAEYLEIEFSTIEVPDPMRPQPPQPTIPKLVAVKKAKKAKK